MFVEKMSARIRHLVDDEDKDLSTFHSTHVNARNPSTFVTFTFHTAAE